MPTKKKPAHKPAATKRARKKAAAKKAKPAANKKKVVAKRAQAPKKKAAAKSKVAKKPSAEKRPAAAKPVVSASTSTERWTAFPPVLEELVEWVNGGRAGDVDLEMYSSFNEQYKPSDWTRNPASDEELFTFAMDGSGGQVAIWRRDDSSFDSLPIVFLGSEGEVRPLAMSLPQFLHQVAHGLGPIELVFGGGEPAPNEDMIEWVKEQFPDARLAEPEQILAEATKSLEDFEKHLMAQVQE